MSELKKSDFAYGAAVSVLMSNGINPTLIDSSKKRNLYSILIDREECLLYVKYSGISNIINSRQRTGEYMVSTGRKKTEYISVRYNRFNELK